MQSTDTISSNSSLVSYVKECPELGKEAASFLFQNQPIEKRRELINFPLQKRVETLHSCTPFLKILAFSVLLAAAIIFTISTFAVSIGFIIFCLSKSVVLRLYIHPIIMGLGAFCAHVLIIMPFGKIIKKIDYWLDFPKEVEEALFLHHQVFTQDSIRIRLHIEELAHFISENMRKLKEGSLDDSMLQRLKEKTVEHDQLVQTLYFFQRAPLGAFHRSSS